jgi:hypothetical protein
MKANGIMRIDGKMWEVRFGDGSVPEVTPEQAAKRYKNLMKVLDKLILKEKPVVEV